MFEAENFVALGFVLFLGLLVYLGAHRRVIDGIDSRQARIKAELDEAVRLRQEAQAVKWLSTWVFSSVVREPSTIK